MLATDSRRVLKIGDRYATFDNEAFEHELPAERLSVEEVARRLGAFLGRHPYRLIAIVGGMDADGTMSMYVHRRA